VSYELQPRYPIIGGELEAGFGPLVRAIGSTHPRVVAIDGPAAVAWTRFIGGLSGAFREAGLAMRTVDVRLFLAPWSEIERRTDAPFLRGDPVFATVHQGPLSELFERVPDSRSGKERTIVFGPGSALFAHDELWYADLPKRLGLDAVEAGRAPNLGRPADARGDLRRLLFIDWPMEDRHRRELATRWRRYIDVSDPDDPRSLEGEPLRRSISDLSRGPFRARPAFLPQPWGGRWLRDVLGAPATGPNLGLGYELIAPEAGVLFGRERSLEVPLDVVVAQEPGAVLGTAGARFGSVFPIRFDYLDTVDGGDLSVHCHPQPNYMREVFGQTLTQHETYYVMVTRPGARIFLGLRDEADPVAFRSAAQRSVAQAKPLDIERFVQTVPAAKHQLYLVPAGTPHGSGEGNVVLEISATPYLYSLRFYDWLRTDLDGGLRPVQLEHAFANLAPDRRGPAITRDLVPSTTPVRTGDGFVEHAFRGHDDLFFAVHRTDLERPVPDRTGDRFHVLNLVEGDEIEVRTASGRRHILHYAETILIPAAVGDYELRPRGPSKIVKAFVDLG
jgi:mannose-6-phosphate isomerase class I